jgi:PST family polysaccharide transporter
MVAFAVLSIAARRRSQSLRTSVSGKTAVSQRTATASGAFVIARIGAKALDFISLTVLARLLTPDDFGLIAIAMVFIQVVEAIFEVPVGAILMRARPITRALLDTGFTVSAIRGLVVFGVLAAAAFGVAHFYSDPRLVWLVLALACAPLARSLSSIRIVLYGRQLRAKPEFWLEVGSKAASLLASVTVAAATRSYWAIAVATLTSPIVSTVGSYFFAPYIPRLRLTEWRSFSGFLGWITLNQFFSALLWQFDKLFLGRFVPEQTLGRFYMAGNISTLPFQVIGTPILRPFAAALALSHARNTLTGAYQKATRGVCVVMAPLIVALALLAHPIVTLLLGAKWEGVSQWLAFLAIATLPALPMQTLPPLCVALNRAGSIAARSGVEFALYLPMVTLGYLWAGIPGVIAAKFLSLLVSAVFSLFLVRSLLHLSIREQLANLLEPAIASLALVLVLAVLTGAIREPTGRIALIAYISGIGCAGTMAYVLVAIALWNRTGRRDGVERVAANLLAALGRRAKLIGASRA